MTKKGPLSKAENFYIQSKYNYTDIDTLCKDLDRAKNQVRAYITEFTVPTESIVDKNKNNLSLQDIGNITPGLLKLIIQETPWY